MRVCVCVYVHVVSVVYACLRVSVSVRESVCERESTYDYVYNCMYVYNTLKSHLAPILLCHSNTDIAFFSKNIQCTHHRPTHRPEQILKSQPYRHCKVYTYSTTLTFDNFYQCTRHRPTHHSAKILKSQPYRHCTCTIYLLAHSHLGIFISVSIIAETIARRQALAQQ